MITLLYLSSLQWILHGAGAGDSDNSRKSNSDNSQKINRYNRGNDNPHVAENEEYREKAWEMFLHAYRGYLEHAYPHDELRPISCTGVSTWGNFSLTLIDSLDTMVIMGLQEEFKDAVKLVLANSDFNVDKNVSVFETNIRVVGGLLSAHLLLQRAAVEKLPEGWPCSGPLLDMAVDVASRLLPAFATPTGLPYGTTNLRYGVPRGETTVTGVAGCGTYLLEFGLLSRLTGDPSYEHAARRALRSLYNARSTIDLMGNHIDVSSAEWVYREAGIGGNVDSYYEYLLKAGLYFDDLELVRQFKVLYRSVVRYLQHEFWYIWANMFSGMPTIPNVSTLDAFWPSLQILIGDIVPAKRTLTNFYSLVTHYGFTPEMFSLLNGQLSPGMETYPLRPEFAESLVHMYQATGDQMWRNMGKQIVDSIEISTKTKCGYATVGNVLTHSLEDSMESFFLSETTKYLYLLFSDDHWVFDEGVWDENVTMSQEGDHVCAPNSFGYTFTTEAHPLPKGVLGCCYPQQKVEDRHINKMFKGTTVVNEAQHPFFSFPLPPVYYPSLPLSFELSTLEDWFLVNVADSHSHCLQSQAPPPPPIEVHSCKIQPWYAKYEVYGAEFKKLVGKKAFRVVDRNS